MMQSGFASIGFSYRDIETTDDAIGFCLDWIHVLNSDDRHFLFTLRQRFSLLTGRQHRQLTAIMDKVRIAEARA
jgi:hypothetical protein